MSKSRFNLYRYQLLPKNRYFQGDLYGPSSIEELIELKNSIFAEALDSPTLFKCDRLEITVQKAFEDEDFYLFRVAVNRSVHLETKDFGSRSVANWPKIWVAVWNSPDVQMIAIQQRVQAFQDSKSVVKLLAKSI